MNIAELINKDAEKYSPYMNGLVNHLPMGQLALFKLTGDVNKVEDYTKYYIKKSEIDKIENEDKKVNSFSECLGKRDLYKPCLNLIREKLQDEKTDIRDLISSVLNEYTLGLSGGLFHTIIRLAYAIEGYSLDKRLKEEVERALAYYITGYREGFISKRKINKKDSLREMRKFISIPEIYEIRFQDKSLGSKLQNFYKNDEFLKKSFLISGSEKDKVRGLLNILIPAFYNTNNIVMLHVITGLHAVVVLKDYFADYNEALDILTTTALAHITTQKDLDLKEIDDNFTLRKSWEEIASKGSDSKDVHTIKFIYSSRDLDKKFKIDKLKSTASKRVKTN